MATVKASAESVDWGARVIFSGEGWLPGVPVTVKELGRYTVPRESGTFDMTLRLDPHEWLPIAAAVEAEKSGTRKLARDVASDGPQDSLAVQVIEPVTLTFDDGSGNTATVTVALE